MWDPARIQIAELLPHVAQFGLERNPPKVEVLGSNPSVRTNSDVEVRLPVRRLGTP